MNKEDFVKKAIKRHGCIYDYSKVVYSGIKNKVKIICHQHGCFRQIPSNHLTGNGCPKCGIIKVQKARKLTLEYLKKRCINIFGDCFNFKKSVYINRDTPVIFICKKCKKEFSRSPRLLYWSKGCPYCVRKSQSESMTYNTEEFIAMAKKIHGKKYDYKKTKYIGTANTVIVLCNVCGTEFKQQPRFHLMGDGGCPKCRSKKTSERVVFSKEEFIKRAILIHGNKKYNYSWIVMGESKAKVKILCNKCNRFFSQRKDQHLSGGGCPYCQQYKGEVAIRDCLIKNGIEFETNKTFPNCRHIRPLFYDFYIPSCNLLIEYDGIQHFKPVCFGGISTKTAIKCFSVQKIRDYKKTEFAKKAGIKLIRFSYKDSENIVELLKNSLKQGTIYES